MITTDSSLRPFLWRVLIVALVASLLFIAWKIATALLLAFGGVLLAVLFSHLTGYVQGWTGLARRWSLAVVLVALLVVLVLAGLLLGMRISSQFGQMSQHITQGMNQLPIDLRTVFSEAQSWLSQATRWASNILSFLAYALLLVFTGIYMAGSPDTYRRGVMLLFPPRLHGRVGDVLDVLDNALWRWFIGTLISMAIIAVLTTIGLLILGVPSAFALGIIAGILEFIPIVGPWLAGIPAVLVAFAAGDWNLVLWVVLLYIAIQQIEGNLIYPVVQRETVTLPPAATIIAVVAFGLLFGVIGVFFATPLLVAALVIVNHVYMKDALGEKPQFPGDEG